MSIFGKLRRAKQAADSQKGKNTAAAERPKTAPYKHIPTHAATDALLGAPASFREEDKKAIQAQHQRRSQYNLSRNPSSLSNVTTLNRDQSFTSAATEQRRQYPVDWAANTNMTRRSQLAPIASNSSRHSQVPSGRSSLRRSRFDTTEQVSQIGMAIDGPIDRPYSNIVIPSKDVKFYLPSSREISPSHSSENSNSSSRSRNSSFNESSVPARHPRRPITIETPVRKFDENTFFQQQHKSPNRKVGECARLSPLGATSQPFPSTRPTAMKENDLSFIDFGRPSSEIGIPIAAH